MLENINPKGTIYIYEGKKEKLLEVITNYVTLNLRKGILQFLKGGKNAVSFGPYKHLAIGDKEGYLPNTYSKLEREIFRKPVTEITQFDNKIIVDTYIEPEEANFTWKQVGLFADGDWGVKDSGTILNVANINTIKNSGSSKTISWEIALKG